MHLAYTRCCMSGALQRARAVWHGPTGLCRRSGNGELQTLHSRRGSSGVGASSRTSGARCRGSSAPDDELRRQDTGGGTPIPAKSYAYNFESPTRIVTRSIGVCRSPYVERAGTPHQGAVGGVHVKGEEVREGVLELFKDVVPEAALRDLDGFSHVWVIFYCHLNTLNLDAETGVNTGWNAVVRPPRLPKARPKVGTLATRAPHRPNPIAMTALKVLRVDAHAREVHVRGLDLLDGSPILDLKPYIPLYDSIPEASSGWLDSLDVGTSIEDP